MDQPNRSASEILSDTLKLLDRSIKAISLYKDDNEIIKQTDIIVRIAKSLSDIIDVEEKYAIKKSKKIGGLSTKELLDQVPVELREILLKIQPKLQLVKK